jgi:hypothetical protein
MWSFRPPRAQRRVPDDRTGALRPRDDPITAAKYAIVKSLVRWITTMVTSVGDAGAPLHRTRNHLTRATSSGSRGVSAAADVRPFQPVVVMTTGPSLAKGGGVDASRRDDGDRRQGG